MIPCHYLQAVYHSRMTVTENLIQNVSDTAFWVAHYRALETKQAKPLFKDPFAQYLIGDHGQKIAESMPEVFKHTQYNVLLRTVIIDDHIQSLISQGVDCVINLGAGLDARPYRLPLPKNLVWIEIDQQSIIRHKENALKNFAPTCLLERFTIDFAKPEERKDLIQDIGQRFQKIAVLTEGVLPYLTQEQVSDLSADLQAQKNIRYWICDYMSPTVYKYINSSLRQQKMRNAPFRFFPEDWFGFFTSRGWQIEKITYMAAEGMKRGRRPPAPWWIPLIAWTFPKKTKEQFLKATGYMILKKS